MFTGIIENLAKIVAIENSQGNLNITLSSSLASELKVDQSVSHNGICLTVVSTNNDQYTVTAIEETINKTTINKWQKGDLINLERAMKIGDRLDGHMIQGHVDQIGKCIKSETKNGSWEYTIEYEKSDNITVEKGSIAINGVSLTVIDSMSNGFKVQEPGGEAETQWRDDNRKSDELTEEEKNRAVYTWGMCKEVGEMEWEQREEY